MNNLRHIWFIAQKDLRLFMTDRLALLFAVLFPFLFVAVFYFLLSGVGGGDTRLELHLATQEADGSMSHQIIEQIITKDDSQLRSGDPKIVWEQDHQGARKAVEDKELAGYLLFPEDFTEGVLMGYGAQLEIVVDTEAINTRAALNGLARSIASQVGSEQVASNAAIGLLVEQGMVNPSEMANIGQDIQQLFSGQGSTSVEPSFIQFDVEMVGEVEAENASNFVIPGYLVMFVFFTAALSAEMVVRERQNHTLERLLTGSISKEAILGGIFTGTAIKGLIQILIFWTIGILVFRLDLGISPIAVVLISVLMVLLSSAFAIMLATITRTQRSAGSIAVLASLVLAPLGGCWWPLFILPRWMQALAKITPHGWANSGFNKLMLFGAEFGDVVPEMLVLVGFAVVFGVIAIWRFRTSATQV